MIGWVLNVLANQKEDTKPTSFYFVEGMAPKNGAQEWYRKGKCKIDQQIPKDNDGNQQGRLVLNRNQVA
jgi:hypothetical protein